MDQCIICIEEGNNVIHLKHKSHCDCEYHVHAKCLKQWVEQNNKCIICRESYLPDDLDRCQLLIYSVILCNIGIVVYIFVIFWYLH
jgi:hypothetical protein